MNNREHIHEGVNEYEETRQRSPEEEYYRALSLEKLEQEYLKEKRFFDERRQEFKKAIENTRPEERNRYSYIGDDSSNVEKLSILKAIFEERGYSLPETKE